jgi:hypothetical protein
MVVCFLGVLGRLATLALALSPVWVSIRLRGHQTVHMPSNASARGRYDDRDGQFISFAGGLTMKHAMRLALVCLMGMFTLNAAKAADGGTSLATQGKPLFQDDFARSEMTPKWRVGKGFWSIKDGVVSIAENPDDKHGAYAYVTPSFVYKDIVAEFSVKLDGAKTCSLMVNDSKYKESHAGHILKATVAAGKINVADWKFGAMKNEIFDKMKDTATTADEKKKLRDSIKDKSADFKVSADFAQWHVVRVEIVADEMLVSVDGKPAAYLKSEGIGHPTKNAIGFEVGGKSVLIKDMKVFEATPASDWSAHRDAVIASLTK